MMPEEEITGEAEVEEATPEVTPVEPTPFVIPRDKLPEEWEGKTPDEIASTWNTAATVLAARNEEVEALRQQLYNQQAQAAQAAQPQPEPVKAFDPEEFKEKVFEDPVGAFDTLLEQRMAPYLRQHAQNSVAVAMSQAERELPDFDEYRPYVEQIISSQEGPATAASVKAAYLMARGYKSVEIDKEATRKAATSERPTAPEPVKSKPKVSELELEIAKGMSMTVEEYVQYRTDELDEIEVPLGDE